MKLWTPTGAVRYNCSVTRYRSSVRRLSARVFLTVIVGSAALAASPSRGNITFDVTPDAGTPQYVIDAFGLAAARWSAVIGNSITVNLQLGWQSLPAGQLGSTSYSLVQENYASVVSALNASARSADDRSAYAQLQPGTTYSRLINHTTDNPNGSGSAGPYVNSLSPVSLTRANARALGLFAGGGADAVIQFNSGVAFDFNPADGTTANQYDFVSIAAHEIGHALGFVSVVNQIEQQSGLASQLPSTILDLFRFSAESLAAGRGFIDSTADTRNKFFSVDGGATTVAQFATGAVYGTGSQADHWREWTWTGLMDPASFPGYPRQFSPADLRAFDVLGYNVPEPGPGVLLVVGISGFLLRRIRKQR